VKITFEGQGFNEILDQMAALLERSGIKIATETYAHAQTATAQPPEPVQEVIAPVDNPLDAPVEKPSPTERMAKARAAKKPKAAKAPAPEHPQEPFSDPADIVKLRQRTINDLQEAYANGHQAEVFELLSRFGNGAKSFRELPADAFVPIREAIDSGALT
jgi:predicted lipid-binding transport protein (Tim44 family)